VRDDAKNDVRHDAKDGVRDDTKDEEHDDTKDDVRDATTGPRTASHAPRPPKNTLNLCANARFP
jgi:hypothetical protein